MDRGWFSRNWCWMTIIGVAVISFLVYLGREHGIAISITFLLGVAAIFFASRSLKLTQDSLELTRATTRPFLTYVVNDLTFDESNTGLLRLTVYNKGNLPAEEPVLQLYQVALLNKTGEPTTDTDIAELRRFIPETSRFKEILKGVEKAYDTTFFPGEARPFNFKLGPNIVQDYQKSKCTAMGVIIYYKSVQREYETVRWFLNDKRKPYKLAFTSIPEKDYFV